MLGPATPCLPDFRIKCNHSFEFMGVDFAGPIYYKVKNSLYKAYVLLFTCIIIIIIIINNFFFVVIIQYFKILQIVFRPKKLIIIILCLNICLYFFAFWKLFTFCIHVTSKNNRRYSKKSTENKCVCLKEVIWLMAMKMGLEMKNRSHI